MYLLKLISTVIIIAQSIEYRINSLGHVAYSDESPGRARLATELIMTTASNHHSCPDSLLQLQSQFNCLGHLANHDYNPHAIFSTYDPIWTTVPAQRFGSVVCSDYNLSQVYYYKYSLLSLSSGGGRE